MGDVADQSSRWLSLHEYASGITVGEIVRNAYGKKSGAVAVLVNGEGDFSYVLEQDCDIEPIWGN